jgi:hypothetical protein
MAAFVETTKTSVTSEQMIFFMGVIITVQRLVNSKQI